MLNLVQLQERLKDVPMQALMQYANGANPQVPPFLALGELNRRKKMQESAAAEQAQEMEGAPTVKQQIEQAAGLMALQGSRQRQAAQQQQGIQANMPMAAPNTTTSEPAQLAGGGFIDDIVVPRDYQDGGMAMNPDMIKKLMMLKAMQQRKAGVAGLPVGKDMFKRSDYAGGGIVAFAGDQGSLVRYDPDKDQFEEDKPASSLGEFLMNLLPSLPKLPSQRKYKDPITGQILSYDEYMARARDPKLRELYRTAAPQTSGRPAQAPARSDESSDAAAAPAAPAAPGRGVGIGSLTATPKPLSQAVVRALGMNTEEMFPDTPARGFDEILNEQRRRQKAMGISEDYLTSREQRLEQIQKRREAERADQPMNELTRFLQGVAAGPRGGTFGTQGAAGVAASTKYREEQRALRDKQDMEMEELKFTVAAKRDAIRRGDMTAAEALEAQEKKLRQDLAKLRFEGIMKQGELGSLEEYRRRSGDIEAARLAQGRDTDNFNRAMTAANLEAERVRNDLRKRAESMMDKGLNAKIKANPNYIDEQVEAARNKIMQDYGFGSRSAQTSPPAAGGNVEVKLPNGKSLYFPNQQAADQFKREAGIR
jgi:hypothetical protein